ncbi:transporter [Caenispirillum bisanense]|uniref:MetA-pathway of phenol degradation n=1 Tax=Caenispirillum bisanense TaxID=414052 RepID=A0A286GWQ9_9PROT|nr:transporter [Caenispirillum bisanense]SOD99494.1 Putative MetA-pathway of phenol degradation [Caenispirillum bisanense]
MTESRTIAAAITSAALCAVLLVPQGAVAAASEEDLARLMSLIEEHERRLGEQEEALAQQRQELQFLKDVALGGILGRGRAPAPPGALDRPSPAARAQVAQAPGDDGATSSTPPGDGSEAGGGARDIELAVIRDVGGVLTPPGGVVIEPELEFSTSSSNRFFFDGVEVVEAVLFGIIEASETDREAATAAVGGRYGVTDRLEVAARVPYVYRNDRIQSTGVNDPSFSRLRDLEGMGVGDVEFGGHYQINAGADDWPIFIGNVRVKAPTGTGPFDVERNSAGLETELPTGSGFWTVEPSVTALVPVDPVVLFGNLGYSYSMGRDIDVEIPDASRDGVARIGRVDPGDSVNLSFGVGVAFNERFSLSVGYEHNYVFATTTEVDGIEYEGDPAHVASFLFGGNFRLNESWSTDLRIAAGLTEEAPDARVTLSFPYRF